MLAETLTAGSLILVAGTQNLVDLLAEVGFRTTDSADDNPDAVVQGYSPNIPWALLDEGRHRGAAGRHLVRHPTTTPPVRPIAVWSPASARSWRWSA